MATPSLKSQAQEERALEMTKYTQPMDGKSGIPPMDLTVQEAARHWETARKHEREARKHLSQGCHRGVHDHRARYGAAVVSDQRRLRQRSGLRRGAAPRERTLEPLTL
jgi:hypothetical protein